MLGRRGSRPLLAGEVVDGRGVPSSAAWLATSGFPKCLEFSLRNVVNDVGVLSGREMLGGPGARHVDVFLRAEPGR
jgi:hypothetical protein